MKELKSDLSKVKVVDWVCTAQHGWCKVSNIQKAQYYGVGVNVLEGTEYYTFAGALYDRDKYPTCFPADQVPEGYLSIFGPPPIEFKDGEPVLVSDDGETWVVRVFKEYSNSKYWVYEYNGKELGGWNCCRKWEDKP